MQHAGLKKIALINSYQRKKLFTEYEVDKPVQITSGNGGGKTSLLKLIPFFYGATGVQILGRSNVTRSFVDWYLPFSNSYLIYEFVTARGQLAHVICFRNLSTKTGIVYQFVKGPFDQSIFINADGEAVSSKDLATSLDLAGAEYERRITSVQEYRGIIQNIHSSSLNSKYHAYSLCSGNRDIKHIEKLTSALIQKDFKIADTKALFLDILEQGDENLDFGVDSDRVKQWCNDYLGLKAFADKKGAFESAIANNHRIRTIIERLHATYASIAAVRVVSAVDLPKLKNEKNVHQQKMDNEIDELLADKRVKASDAEILAESIKRIESEIAFDEERLDEYLDRGIPDYAKRIEQIPELERKLAAQKTQYSELEKVVTDVKGRFEVSKQKLERDFVEYKAKSVSEKLKCKERFVETKEKVSSSYAEKIGAITQRLELAKQTYLDEIGSYKQEIALYNHRLSADEQPADLLVQREALSSKLDSKFTEITECQGAIMVAQTEISTLRHHRSLRLSELEKVTREIKCVKTELETVAQRLDPKSGTLYAYLESVDEGWQSTKLGRVLSDDLLMDTQLNPSLGESTNTLFGLSIDTSHLPNNMSSNASDVERHATLLDTLDELTDKEAELGSALLKNQAQYKQAEINVAGLKSNLTTLQADSDLLKQSIQDKNIEIERFKQALTEELQLSLSVSHEASKLCESRFVELSSKLDNEIELLNRDRLSEMSANETKLEMELDAIEQSLRESEERFNKTLARLEMELEQRLSDKGVNRDLYNRYLSEIEELGALISKLKSVVSEVQAYQAWLAAYEKADPRRKEQRQQKLSEHNQLVAQLQKIDGSIKQIRADGKLALNRLTQKIKDLESVRARCDTAIVTLEDLDIDGSLDGAADSVPEEDIKTVLSEIEVRVPELRSLLKARKQDIQQMEKITLSLGNGELYNFWQETTRDAAGESGYCTDSQRMEVLEKILNDILPQVTQITIESAVNTGRMLVDFKDRLLSFDKTMKQLGRSVSQHVREINTFDVVDSIDISVESTLSKLQGWQDILNFSEIYEEWDRSGALSLPSMEFYKALNLLSYHISSERVKTTTELFDIKFDVVENGNRKVARTDNDINNLASNGTNLIIQTLLYLTLLTRQIGANRIEVTYPIDEIGTLSAENQSKIISMLSANNFKVIAALPDCNSQTAHLFSNLYHINPDKNITNKPRMSRLAMAKSQAQLSAEGQA